jgi:tetratricopeptide (TPR) repeat protein
VYGQRAEWLLKLEEYQKIARQPDAPLTASFNVAQCYFQLDSARQAATLFRAIVRELPREYKTVAWNQLGILAAQQNNLKEALEYFKKALQSNPDYELARFNYELILRRLQQNPPPPPPPPPPQGAPPPPRKPTENNGRTVPWEPVTQEDVQAAYQAQVKREVQYLQQLKKSAKMSGGHRAEPQW